MSRCATCGSTYDHMFDITMNGETFSFDSFECAIHKLAPACGHCGVRVIGHGLGRDGQIFCCEHCATAAV